MLLLLLLSCTITHLHSLVLSDLQAEASLPDSNVKASYLTPSPESPDSPLVFPWSQGPKSTGAASAYASLSDSYLSRPPSQTPSQAPSPSKHAQRDSPSQAPSPKHAQQEVKLVSSPAQHAYPAQHAAGSLPSHSVKRPFESMLETSGSQSPSAGPGYHMGGRPTSPSGSLSGPALPIGPAFQTDSKGPISSGPVSVAPWRQPPRASLTVSPHSPQLSSQAISTTHLPPMAPHPSLNHLPPTRAWHHLSGTDADADTNPKETVSSQDLPSTQYQQQQQQQRLSAGAGIKFPWDQQDGALPLPHGGRMSHDDVTSLASSSSHDLAASSADAAMVHSAAVDAALRESQSDGAMPPFLRKGKLLKTTGKSAWRIRPHVAIVRGPQVQKTEDSCVLLLCHAVALHFYTSGKWLLASNGCGFQPAEPRKDSCLKSGWFKPSKSSLNALLVTGH